MNLMQILLLPPILLMQQIILQLQLNISRFHPGTPRAYPFPALLNGSRCYVDAAISPDNEANLQRTAGIGVFIFHQNQRLQLYIQARFHHATSVLMAEAGALALAAKFSSLLSAQEVSFFSDNETVVNILNNSWILRGLGPYSM